jgi:hypothetical protein
VRNLGGGDQEPVQNGRKFTYGNLSLQISAPPPGITADWLAKEHGKLGIFERRNGTSPAEEIKHKKTRLYGRFMTESRSQSKKKKEKKQQQQGGEIRALTFSGDGEDAILPKEKGSEQGKRLASFFILAAWVMAPPGFFIGFLGASFNGAWR